MTAPTTLKLVGNWDAPLVYDVLREEPDEAARPVFVGRAGLVGSLTNAISEPDRRGTYLVSGYRGAGKTSLVIEAARQAAPRLEQRERVLLPLVLNVSEVSASLGAAGETMNMPPLGIDARRLLTALLRALRNELDLPGRRQRPPAQAEAFERARTMVARTYEKAEASQYSRRAVEGAEAKRSDTRTSKSSIQVANVLKLVAALALVAAAALGAALVSAATAVITALVGAALISYASSRTVTRETSERSSLDTEIVFDNSLHQIESDLKQILATLDHAGMRTIVVLEELDKVEDEKGEQLDAVIRYFKNLFTQAPALFFFLTDKQYFDVVDAKLAAARREGSYAIEHTFFTHRMFVSRPALEECLEYLSRVIDGEDARAALEQIAETHDARSRSLSDMSLTERFLRVLLLYSRNHLFDLKREMRRYVRDDEDGGAQMVFDERSFPPREQGLAAFHFLLEQKLKLYWFGGGRDYANEILRNCLSAAFIDIGAEEPVPASLLQPTEREQADLRRDDRAVIGEALKSLIDDLERGGAIEALRGTTQTDPEAAFRWRDNPVSTFSPSPKLESHEETLREQLVRAIRVAEQFAPNGPLEQRFGSGPHAEELASRYQREINRIGGARTPLTREQAQALSGEITKSFASLLADARGAHQQQLRTANWSAEALSANLFLVTSARLLLVYGPDDVPHAAVERARASLGPGPVAAVLLDDDPDATSDRLASQWREWLGVDPDSPALVTVVPLGEGLSAADVDSTWGRRTLDEIAFARLWLQQSISPAPEPHPAWLYGPGERRFDSVQEALAAWLDGPARILAAPPGAGNTPAALIGASADLVATGRSPVLLHSGVFPPVAPGDSPYLRLGDAGRLIPISMSPPAEEGRWVLLMASPPEEQPPDAPMSVLRLDDGPAALSATAEFLDAIDSSLSTPVYERAAEHGDSRALGELVIRKQQAGELTAELVDRLVATADWETLGETGLRLRGSSERTRLLTAVADHGDMRAVVELTISAKAREDANQWDARLLESGSTGDIVQVAAALRSSDPRRALDLFRAAAERGDTGAMREVLVSGVATPEQAREALEQLHTEEAFGLLAEAAQQLEARNPALATAIRKDLPAATEPSS